MRSSAGLIECLSTHVCVCV